MLVCLTLYIIVSLLKFGRFKTLSFTVEKSVTAWCASEELGHGSQVDGTVLYSETGMFC